MTLPNGAKLYRWALQVSPHLFDVSEASKAFGVPERTLWRWREQIKADSTDCHQWRHTATGEGIAPLVAVTATDGSIVPLVAEPENCHPRQHSATGGSNSLRGDLGGSSKTDSTSPKPKNSRTAKKSREPSDAAKKRAFYEHPPFVDFPALYSEDIREAWAAFIGNKKRRAAGPLVEASVLRHLSMLQDLGHPDALKCIWYSADGNYPGLYPDRFEPKTARPTSNLTVGQNSCNELMAQYKREADAQRNGDAGIESPDTCPNLTISPSLPGMEAEQRDA